MEESSPQRWALLPFVFFFSPFFLFRKIFSRWMNKKLLCKNGLRGCALYIYIFFFSSLICVPFFVTYLECILF